MKYDVCSLASSLFWHFPVVLDLDTGKTHTLYSAATASEIARLKSPKRIPHYSESPIYRRYLELARDLGVIDAGEPTLARRWLNQSLRGRAWLGPWQAAKAERALRAL